MRASIPLLLLALTACHSPRTALPRIAELYNDAAKKETRNPVVVIHGILGARLAQRSTDKTVWGAFTSRSINPNTDEGARAMALPLSPPANAMEYDAETADVYPTGPLEALEFNFLFQVLSVDVYAAILRTLGAGGYTDNVVLDPLSPAYSENHFTCFSFFYDWRRDNVENAIRFGEYLDETRAHIYETAGKRIIELRASGSEQDRREADSMQAWLDEGFRFDVVAHSMGGLVARYFLRYGATDLPADGSIPEVTWRGAEQIDRLIMVGTPNFGAMDALRNLTEGFQVAAIFPHFHQALLGTMPSIYQLLPRTRHRLFVDSSGRELELDVFDPEVWERFGWGLMDPSSEAVLARLEPNLDAAARRAKAKEYVTWSLQRASRFHRALDQVPPTAPPTRLYLFAGDTEDTLSLCRIEQHGARTVPQFDRRDLTLPGDATVPRYSAVGDERRTTRDPKMYLRSPIPWSNVTFLADDHIGITSNPHFSNNTLFLLLETPPPAR